MRILKTNLNKRVLSLILAISFIMPLFGGALTLNAAVRAGHIVGNETPPAEAPVENFTVGFVGPGDYVEPTNNYMELFTPDGLLLGPVTTFYFVTGDPAFQNVVTHNVTTPTGQVVNATVKFLPRVTWSQTNAALPAWSIDNVSELPNDIFNHTAASATARADRTFFFDGGRFLDTVHHDSNSFSGDNTSIVGVGDTETVFFKIPVPGGTNASPNLNQRRMLRYRFNTPNNYIRNVVFDGSGIDMRPQNGWGSGTDRGSYFWVVGHGSANFVARDVVIRNIGASNAGGASLAANQRNVALNILRASEHSTQTPTPGPRHFIDITIENVMTTSSFGVVQMNQTSHTYFYNLDLRNPTAAGTGVAQNINAYPVKIEHNVTQDQLNAWLGGDVSNQHTIIFDGELLVPDRGSQRDAIYLQDYRYRNILLPSNFNWALLRDRNGDYNNPAIRVYNRKVSPMQTGILTFRGHAALQLNTGYWLVEAPPTVNVDPWPALPTLQQQLNTINDVRNEIRLGRGTLSPVAGPGPWTEFIPHPHIKMIANANGQLGGFTIPNFHLPSDDIQTVIVALMRTDTPRFTVYPARAHASDGVQLDGINEFVPFIGAPGSMIFPADSNALIFNFDFKTVVLGGDTPPGWTIEEAEDFGKVNFTRANSGRNLYLRIIYTVRYQIDGPRPAFHPLLPAPENFAPGDDVPVAGNFPDVLDVVNGVPGRWVFLGWNDEDHVPPVDIDEEYNRFVMPGRDVLLTGRWLFVEGFNVIYEIEGIRPDPHPDMPDNITNVAEGTEITVAEGFPSFAGEHNGVPGTWTFNGWETEDLDDSDIVDGEFEMPGRNVRFVGTWTFTPDGPPPEDPTIEKTRTGGATGPVLVGGRISYTITVTTPEDFIGLPLISDATENIYLNAQAPSEPEPDDIDEPDDIEEPDYTEEPSDIEEPDDSQVLGDMQEFGDLEEFNALQIFGDFDFEELNDSDEPGDLEESDDLDKHDDFVEPDYPQEYEILIPELMYLEISPFTTKADSFVVVDVLDSRVSFDTNSLVVSRDSTVLEIDVDYVFDFDPNTRKLRVYLLTLPADSVTVITFEVTALAVGLAPNVAILYGPEDEFGERHEVARDDVEVEIIAPPQPPVNGGNGGGGGHWLTVRPRDVTPRAPVAEGVPTPMSPYHLAYIIGYPEDGSVRPSANITRAEVATIFFRLISDQHRVDVWSQTNPFADVVLIDWFNNAISTLANDGLLMGYPDGYFRPNQSITRAEFATIVIRVMGYSHVEKPGSSFNDISGHWAQNHIHTAHYLGWVQGYGDGTFRPDQAITRAEVAALVNRSLNRLPEHPGDLLPNMVTWPDNMNENAWYYLYIQEATNSHYHEMKADGIHERWTELILPREWWRLERPDSNPHIFTGEYIGAGMDLRE